MWLKVICPDREIHHHRHEWNSGRRVPYPEKNTSALITRDEMIARGMKNFIRTPGTIPLSYQGEVPSPAMVD